MSGDEKEFLRHAVLECLVSRHPVALPVAGVVRRVKAEVDFSFDQDDVAAALELLAGLGLVEWQYDELGSSKWWKASAKGVLGEERK